MALQYKARYALDHLLYIPTIKYILLAYLVVMRAHFVNNIRV